MNASKIMFPTDFSELNAAALEFAASLANDTGATLMVVYVDTTIPSIYGTDFGVYATRGEHIRDLQSQLEKVRPRQKGVPCVHRLLEGDPATEIVEFAERENVDVIVMGTHGRTGVRRLLMGSVAEAVVRRATCPVLTVKAEAKETAAVSS